MKNILALILFMFPYYGHSMDKPFPTEGIRRSKACDLSQLINKDQLLIDEQELVIQPLMQSDEEDGLDQDILSENDISVSSKLKDIVSHLNGILQTEAYINLEYDFIYIRILLLKNNGYTLLSSTFRYNFDLQLDKSNSEFQDIQDILNGLLIGEKFGCPNIEHSTLENILNILSSQMEMPINSRTINTTFE